MGVCTRLEGWSRWLPSEAQISLWHNNLWFVIRTGTITLDERCSCELITCVLYYHPFKSTTQEAKKRVFRKSYFLFLRIIHRHTEERAFYLLYASFLLRWHSHVELCNPVTALEKKKMLNPKSTPALALVLSLLNSVGQDCDILAGKKRLNRWFRFPCRHNHKLPSGTQTWYYNINILFISQAFDYGLFSVPHCVTPQTSTILQKTLKMWAWSQK